MEILLLWRQISTHNKRHINAGNLRLQSTMSNPKNTDFSCFLCKIATSISARFVLTAEPSQFIRHYVGHLRQTPLCADGCDSIKYKQKDCVLIVRTLAAALRHLCCRGGIFKHCWKSGTNWKHLSTEHIHFIERQNQSRQSLFLAIRAERNTIVAHLSSSGNS